MDNDSLIDDFIDDSVLQEGWLYRREEDDSGNHFWKKLWVVIHELSVDIYANSVVCSSTKCPAF